MSIINEAIKKARKEFEIKTKNFPTAFRKVDIHPAVARKPSKAKWLAIVSVSLILVISLLGSVVLYRHLTRVDTMIIEDPGKDKTKTAAVPDEPRGIKVPSYRDFSSVITLNGIVHGPEGKWAIINNKITREGDSVPGGMLTLITKDFVKIKKYNDEEIVLELR